jgi:hypothetical protein
MSAIGLVIAVLALLSIVSDRSKEGSKETSSWHSELDVRGPLCPIGDCGNAAVRLEIGVSPRFEVEAILSAPRWL